MSDGAQIIRATPARLIGWCNMVTVESGALIMCGLLGLTPGSTTTGPPANDVAARPA